ncbi:unnamed protein product [Pylaiella littoralis]
MYRSSLLMFGATFAFFLGPASGLWAQEASVADETPSVRGSARSLASSSAPDMCSNGVAGVEDGDAKVCCVAGCGGCGGVGCSTMASQYGAADCCIGPIEESGIWCSESGTAPCIIDAPDMSCSNGVAGVQDGNAKVCCVAGCGGCGGVGCSTMASQYGASDCCIGPIEDSGIWCSDSETAPCIIDDFPNCNVAMAGFGNGRCSKLIGLNTEECGWDGGDCCECDCEDGVNDCGTNGYDCQNPDSDCFGT